MDLKRSTRAIATTAISALAFGLTFAPALATAAPLGQVTEFNSGLNTGSGALPLSLTAGPDGNVWFTDPRREEIGRITPSGTITEFSSGLGPNSDIYSGLAVGADGNLWFDVYHYGYEELEGEIFVPPSISRITPSGSITEFTQPPAYSEAGALTPGADGNIWFPIAGYPPEEEGEEAIRGEIGRIVPGGTITRFTGLETETTADDLTAGPDGDIWFVDDPVSGSASSMISRISPSGTITNFSNSLGVGISNLTAGPDGNLWFVTGYFGEQAIGRITPSGTSTVFTAGLGPESDLSNLIVGPDGNLWFLTSSGIGRITPSGTITEFANVPGAESAPLRQLIAGPDGNLWFLAHSGFGRITPSGTITEFGRGSKNPIYDLIAGPDGNLWFTTYREIEHYENEEYSLEVVEVAIGRIGTEGELPPPKEEGELPPPKGEGGPPPPKEKAPGGGGGGAGGAGGGGVSNAFTASRPKANKSKGTAAITFNLPGPGSVGLSGKGIKRASKAVGAAGPVTLNVIPTAKTKKTLKATGKATVSVKATYTPTGGGPSTKTIPVKLSPRRFRGA